MNPELIKAARAAMQLPDGADVEGYMRQATGGKYGFDDATAYLKTINPGVTLGNVARSVAQGVTMGNAADMIDRANAMPAPSDPLSQALSHAAQSIRGSGQDFRARDAAYAQAHPVLNAVGNVSGGVGAAVGAAAALPEIGGAWLAKAPAALRALLTTLKGTATGLGMGTANAYGAQEPGEKDLGAAATSLPALGGAAVGTAAPLLTGGFNYLAQPAKQAMNRFGTAVTQSKGVQALLATLEKYKAAGLEKEVTMGDLSPAMAAARDLAVTGNQEASQSVGNTALVRQAGSERTGQSGMIQRLIDRVHSLTPEFGTEAPSNSDTLERLRASRRAWAAGPEGFGGLNPDQTIVPNTNLVPKPADIPTMPAGAAAHMSLAKGLGEDPADFAQTILSRPTTEGPFASRFGAAGDPTQQNAQSFMDHLRAVTAAKPTPVTPNILTKPIVSNALRDAQDVGLIKDIPTDASTLGKLMQVERMMRDKANVAITAGGGKSETGFALKRAAGAIREHLIENNPDYMGVTQEYAQRMGLERAVQKGMDAWNSGDKGLLLRTAQAMSAPELLEYRRALASSMYQKFDNVDPMSNVAKTFLDPGEVGERGSASRALQAKLRMIFPDAESYGNFMTHAAHESRMFEATQAGGGTQTARRLIAQQNSTEPVGALLGGMGQTMMPSIGNLPHTVIQRGIFKAAAAGISNKASGELGNIINIQGYDALKKFLTGLGSGEGATPLVGRGATTIAPAAAASAIPAWMRSQPPQ